MFLLFIGASHALAYSSILGARYNPLGLVEQFKLCYRYRFFESDSPLWQPAGISVGTSTNITPAYIRAGPTLEITPLAVLQLSVTYEGMAYFGTFRNLQSKPDGFADISDTVRNSATDNYPTMGNLLHLGALLQAKVGPIGARSNNVFSYANVRVRPGDTVWYDAWNDFLAPANGWQVTSENDLFYMSKFGLFAGIRYTASIPFRPGPGTHQRVGPIALYEFFDKPGSAFNKPALVAMVQWFFQHPYRVGPLPQLILAFIFQGEIPLQKR